MINIKPEYFDSIAYFPIGIPGSGKSTFGNKMISEKIIDPDAIISSDLIRQELYGHFTEQGDPQEVFRLAHSRLRSRLRSGLNTYFDATNVTAKARNPLIEESAIANAKIVWIHFDVETSICRERNNSRPYPVPENVMEKMDQNIKNINWSKLPGTILYVNEKGEIVDRKRN